MFVAGRSTLDTGSRGYEDDGERQRYGFDHAGVELRDQTVDMAQLHKDYKPMLRLVREIIGVVPNCDPYLEIWPAGFRTYNLLVRTS